MTRTAVTPHETARRWSISALLWVIALTVMSAFQFWRDAPIDGVIFGVIAVVLVVERLLRMRAIGSRPASSTPADASRRLAIIIAVTLTAGLVNMAAPRTGPVSIALIAALGVGAVMLVWNRVPSSRVATPQSRRRSRIAWASVGIALCVWEALAYILSVAVPRGWIGFPTVSLLLEPAVDFDPTRALLTAAWLAAGVWLVAGTASRRSAARAGARS